MLQHDKRIFLKLIEFNRFRRGFDLNDLLALILTFSFSLVYKNSSSWFKKSQLNISLLNFYQFEEPNLKRHGINIILGVPKTRSRFAISSNLLRVSKSKFQKLKKIKNKKFISLLFEASLVLHL